MMRSKSLWVIAFMTILVSLAFYLLVLRDPFSNKLKTALIYVLESRSTKTGIGGVNEEVKKILESNEIINVVKKSPVECAGNLVFIDGFLFDLSTKKIRYVIDLPGGHQYDVGGIFAVLPSGDIDIVFTSVMHINTGIPRIENH